MDMRKLIPLCLLLITSIFIQAQTKFFEGSWQDAFDTAKKQNKYLFVDCYTDWCSWCKVADKKTFPSKEVSTFLNGSFVSVKVDMERGKGVYLGMRYRVLGYPSFLIFTPDGKLAHKMSGYFENPVDFVVEAKKAFDEKSRPDYPSKLTDDVSFPKFYEASFTNKDLDQKRSRPDSKEVEAWLDKQENWIGEAAWSVVYKFPLSEKYNMKFLENRKQLTALYGNKEIQDKISSIAYQKLQVAMRSKDEADLKLVMDFADQYMEEDKEENKAYYKLKFCQGKGDWSEYAKCAQGMIDLYGFENHFNGVNQYSWTIYENAVNEDVLNTAIGWMKKVAEADPFYMYLDTYAALLYKVGSLNEALIWAEKAMAAGKANDENVDETVKLKDLIIAAKSAK